MERKSSPWATGLAIAGLLAVLLVGYVAAYWWRLSTATAYYDKAEAISGVFPNDFETRVFAPAFWLHWKLNPGSLLKRANEVQIYDDRFQTI